MSGPEIVISIVGALVGYWIVSSLVARVQRPPTVDQGPIGQERAKAQPAAYQDELSSVAWHSVLGVLADAPVDDIRSAYKILRSQYHPDKVAALGPELRALAEHKSREISAAYRQGMRERGVSEQLW